MEKGRLGYIVHHSKLPDKILLWVHALLYKISSLGYILQVSFFLFCLNHLTQISYLPRFLVPALFPVISSPSCSITIFDHVTHFWEGSRRLETEQDVLFFFFWLKVYFRVRQVGHLGQERRSHLQKVEHLLRHLFPLPQSTLFSILHVIHPTVL